MNDEKDAREVEAMEKFIRSELENEENPDWPVSREVKNAFAYGIKRGWQARPAAEGEVERLRAALEHYAWQDNWEKDGYGNFTEWQVYKHGYDIARDALDGKPIAKLPATPQQPDTSVAERAKHFFIGDRDYNSSFEKITVDIMTRFAQSELDRIKEKE